MAIDSHCHLDDDAFVPDRDAVIARAQALGVRGIVVPAYRADCFDRLRDCCARPSLLSLWPAYGLHPCYVAAHETEHVSRLEDLLATTDAVAVGEIGLDRHAEDLRHPGLWRRQQDLLAAQLQLAQSYDLPVILHARSAYAELISMLRRHRPCAGVVHAFNGRLEQAYAFLDLGLVLGVGGVITQPSAQRLRDILRRLPQDAWVLESDAPDMLPYEVYRAGGRRNEPSFLAYNIAALAQTLERSPVWVAQQAEQTTRRILRLPALDASE